jgi:hypothetical protein
VNLPVRERVGGSRGVSGSFSFRQVDKQRKGDHLVSRIRCDTRPLQETTLQLDGELPASTVEVGVVLDRRRAVSSNPTNQKFDKRGGYVS